MNELKATRICSKCGRELPIERFPKNSKSTWCKNCISFYTSKGHITEDNMVKIERLYKEPIPQRILDTKQAGIELVGADECFVQLINYKNAWISNYGRAVEYNNGKYVFKRTKDNESGEKACTLQKNIYDGEKWIWQKQTIEVWKLVVGAFIVNFDMVGNTHCWHKDNNKADNYYKHIYPVNDKQYNTILQKIAKNKLSSLIDDSLLVHFKYIFDSNTALTAQKPSKKIGLKPSKSVCCRGQKKSLSIDC